MAVVFLDIDGVMCTPLSLRLDQLLRRPMDRQTFDPIALWGLRGLVRHTGAQVVLSSSWRYSPEDPDPFTRRVMDNLCRTLERNGTPVADIAPILGLTKGEEVAAWLDRHPGTGYVILDDRSDQFLRAPALKSRLVLVDGLRGLRPRDCRQALALLNQTQTNERGVRHD